jgi:hypothetical protein
VRVREFCLLQNVGTVSGTHPASYSTDIRIFYPELKRSGYKTDNLRLRSFEIQNYWNYNPTTSLPLCIFMGCHRKSPLSCRLYLYCVVVLLCSTVDEFQVCIVGIRHYYLPLYASFILCILLQSSSLGCQYL